MSILPLSTQYSDIHVPKGTSYHVISLGVLYSFSLDIELEAMNKSALEQAIIDILGNDIWDVDHNHGKIKRTAIERLSKLVEHIYEKEKQDPASAYELSCYGCG